MNTIISAKDLVKTYGQGGDRVAVLNHVSVGVQTGESVSVMGPSGSGKTTLLFALSGMDPVDAGTVSFERHNLAALKEEELADLRRRRMGFIFQQPPLPKNLNLLDNILLPALRDNRKNAAALTQKARRLMEKTGIAGLEQRDTTQVSGGQLQRAGICRALMSDPVILFGDEPTGALNSKSAQEVMDLLAQINAEGTAVMLVTHDAKVAAQTGRVLFMKDGEIAAELRLPPYGGADLEERTRLVARKMQEIELS